MSEIQWDKNWNWNIWHGNEWVGFIRTPELGFKWINGREGYRINNVPPPASTRQNPDYEVFITEDGRLHQGEALDEKAMAKKTTRKFRDRPHERATQGRLTKDVVGKDAPAHATGATRPSPPRRDRPVVSTPLPPAQAPRKPESAKERALKADAKQRLAKHKADEAAELAENDPQD